MIAILITSSSVTF